MNTKSHPYFLALMLKSGQKLASGMLANITLEVVPFERMQRC
jgi:hypothetical protein